MSQVFRAANFVRTLEKKDIRILMGIELGMRRFNFVPLEQISFYARIGRDKTQYRLDKLHKLGLLQRNSNIGYVGYRLIMESYDILALNALVEKNHIVGVGDPIGRGKESDVFFAFLPSGKKVVLKIHRIGQTSFRKVKILRSYVKSRHHISWLYISRLSAEREFEALSKLAKFNFNTPRPIAQNRHIVVMEFIDGLELNMIPTLENPMQVLDKILYQIEMIFKEAGIIHCDLSEFNIIVNKDEDILIIDWPQWVPSDHPNAIFYMTRDLNNIRVFFEKKYKTTFDVDEMLDKLFGKDRPKNQTYEEPL